MTTIRLVLQPSDVIFLVSIVIVVIAIVRSLKKQLVRDAYKKLFQRPLANCAAVILGLYLFVAVLDSVHFQRVLANVGDGPKHYDTKVISLLDLSLPNTIKSFEKTYSSPFALTQYVRESSAQRGFYYPRLKHIDTSIKTDAKARQFIYYRVMLICLASIVVVFLMLSIYRYKVPNITVARCSLYGVFYTLLFITLGSALILSQSFHILGTGKIGQDIFYYVVKSIRTGMFIGLVTIMVMLPFAVILGIAAGFFGGFIDDIIQYIYITISSIPGVLLIAASVLSIQVFIAANPDFFHTLNDRADMRLVALCVILGLTNWTGLCRMIRAETLKLREMDYINAAKVLGSSSSYIIFRHILPNVMHLLLIALAIDFSFLVLAEAVLSYIGVGVSPLTISWGNMINGARLELAREPIVWWPVLSAFIFMFGLVLSANIFADSLRDAFDPRAKS